MPRFPVDSILYIITTYISAAEMAYLSTAKISMPEVLLFPYLKVISSGCFFLDVILTTELSACRDCM